MINLIPNEEKKKKLKDFYFRLLVTFFTVTGFSILIATVAILPAYFLSEAKRNLSYVKFDSDKEEAPLAESTLTMAEEIEKRLSLIEETKDASYPVTEKVIGQILLHKMGDIKINSITYLNDAKGKSVNITGTAPSRERLLIFRQRLEEDRAYQRVDLPISNFVRGSNINFSMSLTLI